MQKGNSRLASSGETREWQYTLIGFDWVLQYRRAWYKNYVTDIVHDGCTGTGGGATTGTDTDDDTYYAATPSGYAQDGYENAYDDGKNTGKHTDKFRKTELTWTTP